MQPPLKICQASRFLHTMSIFRDGITGKYWFLLDLHFRLYSNVLFIMKYNISHIMNTFKRHYRWFLMDIITSKTRFYSSPLSINVTDFKQRHIYFVIKVHPTCVTSRPGTEGLLTWNSPYLWSAVHFFRVNAAKPSCLEVYMYFSFL